MAGDNDAWRPGRIQSRTVRCPVMMPGIPSSDIVAKRHEFGLFELLCRAVEHRKRMVRVGIRVAVSGKMFADRHDAAIGQSTRKSHSKTAYPLGILAKRTIADDRIAWVGIDIEHRGEVDSYAKFAALSRHFASVVIQQIVVGNSSQTDVIGEARRVGHTHGRIPIRHRV